MKLNNPDIKLFDIYVAAILGELYDSFPEPVWLDPAWNTVITPMLLESGLIDGDIQNYDESLEVCSQSMNWLFSNNYFSASYHEASDSYDNATLTEKGFDVLNARPNSLDSSAGQQLSNFSQDVGKEISKGYILDLIKWLTNALFS